MKLRRLLLGGCAAFLSCSVPDHSRPAPAELLQQVDWLAGTWTLRSGEVTTEEHWEPANGSMLLGTSHTYTAARSLGFEFLRIVAKDGSLAYVAMPGGAPATVFPLVRSGPGFVVFENARHDHPQRIRYERTGPGFAATISQLDGSRAQTFVFTRG